MQFFTALDEDLVFPDNVQAGMILLCSTFCRISVIYFPWWQYLHSATNTPPLPVLGTRTEAQWTLRRNPHYKYMQMYLA